MDESWSQVWKIWKLSVYNCDGIVWFKTKWISIQGITCWVTGQYGIQVKYCRSVCMYQACNQIRRWTVLWVYFGVFRGSSCNKSRFSIRDKGSCREFRIGKYKIDTPEIYLGGQLARKELNVNQAWTISSIYYIKVVVNNLEERRKKQGMKLPARETTTMLSAYRPDLDVKAELDANNITIFQDLIQELIWVTEIGRVDILHEVSVFCMKLW